MTSASALPTPSRQDDGCQADDGGNPRRFRDDTLHAVRYEAALDERHYKSRFELQAEPGAHVEPSAAQGPNAPKGAIRRAGVRHGGVGNMQKPHAAQRARLEA